MYLFKLYYKILTKNESCIEIMNKKYIHCLIESFILILISLIICTITNIPHLIGYIIIISSVVNLFVLNNLVHEERENEKLRLKNLEQLKIEYLSKIECLSDILKNTNLNSDKVDLCLSKLKSNCRYINTTYDYIFLIRNLNIILLDYILNTKKRNFRDKE